MPRLVKFYVPNRFTNTDAINLFSYYRFGRSAKACRHLTVTEQLRKRGDIDEVGGPFYITQLSSKVASSAHIEYHARIIAQKYLARELISFSSDIESKAFDETLDVDDLMQGGGR